MPGGTWHDGSCGVHWDGTISTVRIDGSTSVNYGINSQYHAGAWSADGSSWQELQPEVNELWPNILAGIPSIEALCLLQGNEQLLHFLVYLEQQRNTAEPVLVPTNRLEFKERHSCVEAMSPYSLSLLLFGNYFRAKEKRIESSRVRGFTKKIARGFEFCRSRFEK